MCIYVIRDYRSILDSPNSDEPTRYALSRQRMICIQIDSELRNLAVHGTHVAVTTVSIVSFSWISSYLTYTQSEELIFFDTSTLPELPPGDPEQSEASRIARHTLDIHAIKSITGAGICNASCIQMDRRCIYATYEATVDAGIGGVLDPTPGSKNRCVPPARALEGSGRCVRVWDFGSA
jgi:hypothetical protein